MAANRSPSLLALGILASIAIAPGALGQRVVLDAKTKPLGSTSRTTIVRAGAELYSLSVRATGALLLLVSTDNGKTWADSGFTFNDSNSGIGGTVLTNYCCLAVDSRGWLHASWRRAQYPSFYTQYYRNVDPKNTSQASDILDVQTTLAKASLTTRSASMGLSIDRQGYVYMLTTESTWRAQVFRSDQPFAPGKVPSFTSLGAVDTAGSATQQPMIDIDMSGRVHCIFHLARGSRSVAHNVYDPATKAWSGTVRLGTPANNNGMLASDRLGNVHALYGVGGTPNTIEYRKWTASGGWGQPIVVASFTSAQLGNSNGQFIFTIAAQPLTGTAFAIYRDFAAGGALVVAQKGVNDAAFSHVTTVEPKSSGQNAYFLPNVRGSLNPFPTNSAVCELDIVYQDRSGTDAKLVYNRIDVCSVGVFGTGCSGANGVPTLAYGELPRLGRDFVIELDKAKASSAALLLLGASKTAWGALPLPLDLAGIGASGCALRASPDSLWPIATDAQGQAAFVIPLPNDSALLGVGAFNQYAVLDAAANAAGLVTSNGGEFTIRG